MTVNGTQTITTYFILNKKDRAGKAQPRPFQAVLEAMRRQETEEAKLKQSSSLKGGTVQNPPPQPAAAVAPPAPKENGFIQVPPQSSVNITPTETIEIPVPMKIHHEEHEVIHHVQKPKIIQNQPIKTSDVMSEQQDSARTYNGQQSRSKACELL
jgi:hypothetical protein